MSAADTQTHHSVVTQTAASVTVANARDSTGAT